MMDELHQYTTQQAMKQQAKQQQHDSAQMLIKLQKMNKYSV